MTRTEEKILGKGAYVGWDIARRLQERGHEVFWDNKGWAHCVRCARCREVESEPKAL
jgi:hypothetical protein